MCRREVCRMLKWIVILAVVVLVLAFWPVSLIPRLKRRPEMNKLREYDYAHRGLHDKKAGIPENSMKAFQRAMELGYGMELDVHLTKDGGLVVMHDDSLKRTCGVNAMVKEKTMAELQECCLEGTEEKIPILSQVLNRVNGQVPLLIEIKTVRGDYKEICRAVCRELDTYKGLYCIESFDPRVLHWLKKNRPDMVRGQLSEYFRKHGTRVNVVGDFLHHNLFSNVLTRPDFISYQHLDRKAPSLWLCRKLYGVSMFNWTVKDPETLKKVRKDGGIAIFEDFLPEKRRKEKRKEEKERQDEAENKVS